jgi:hypothetical protein
MHDPHDATLFAMAYLMSQASQIEATDPPKAPTPRPPLPPVDRDSQTQMNPYEPPTLPKRIDSHAWRRRRARRVDAIAGAILGVLIAVYWAAALLLN